MPIKEIKTDNFLYTKNSLQLEFCEGINIFIGGNGTGKTTLLKTIYNENKGSIFIPTAEMLSHSRGLLAFDREYKLPFDRTQIDILAKAQIEKREISETTKKLLTKIGGENVINGVVLYENDTFYVKKHSGELVEFSAEADGFRKFGLLWKLLQNGLLENGDVLLWDEPEASINPSLIPVLVEVLLEMQNNGVQIFIATHSYDIARWFELKKNSNNILRYFNFYKSEKNILYNQADNYSSLTESVLEDADEKLYKAVVAEAMGVKIDE